MFEYSFTNAGQVDQPNREVKMKTTSDFATVTSYGWLNQFMFSPDEILPTDHIAMNYGVSGANPGGTYEVLVPIFDSSGVITLLSTLPVNSVQYTGTPAQGDIAVFANSNGTIQPGAALATNKSGSFQAGTTTGIGGAFISRPNTAGRGGFSFSASNNSGNFLTTLTNASMGQNTSILIPDPAAGAATICIAVAPFVVGNFVKASTTTGVLADGGAKIFANTSSLWGGGTSQHTFPVTGMLTTDIITGALILTSSNVVVVDQAIPMSGGLQVFFSADPGANTSVVYSGYTAALPR